VPPTAVNASSSATPPVTPDFSLKSRLLPFVEQGAAYNALNMSANYDFPDNFTVRTIQITSFLCPSDGFIPNGTVTVGTQTGQPGYSSYPNNIGTFARNFGNTYDGPAYEAGANTGGVVSFAAVTDGTSNTAMFSEFIRGKNDANSDGPFQIYRSSDSSKTAAPTNQLMTNCQKAGLISQGTPLTASAQRQKGADWLNQNCAKGGGYSHVMPPNTRACFFSDLDASKTYTMVSTSSYHSGGVNAAFLDGSVKFVKSSVNPATWWALATKAGGEVVSADSY